MKKGLSIILLIVIILVSLSVFTIATGNETAGAVLTFDEDGNLTHVETGNGKINANENSTAGNNPIEVAGD